LELLLEHLGKGLWLSLMLSMPAVLLAAGLGLIIGILQAVTQVQEQTIAAAPKIIGVFLLIILGGGLMMNMLTDYVREAVFIAFNEIPQKDLMVLPPKPKTPNQQRAMSFFQSMLKEPGKAGQVASAMEQSGVGNDGEGRNSPALVPGGTRSPQPGIAEQMNMNR
jgi:flagellar biosynthetic protein FliQ